MSSWLFYLFGLLAFVTAGFFVIQSTSGTTSTAHIVGSGVFTFLGIFSLAVGNTVRVMDQRLRAAEVGSAKEPRHAL